MASEADAQRGRRTGRRLALAAVFYCLWAVIGGDEHTVLNAFVALLLSVPLYLFVTRRTQPAILRQAPVAPPAPLEDERRK